MPHTVSVSDARNRWREVFRSAVDDRQPVAIERGGVDRALLIGMDELEALLAEHTFEPEVFFEEGAVTIWLPELALYGRGADFEHARSDLILEVREYVDEYLDEAELYRRSPNRSGQFPHVIKAFVAESADRLADVLFAAPEPGAPA